MKAPHQRARWHNAYDAQMSLWRWYRTRHGLNWMQGVFRANTKGHPKHFEDLLYRLIDGETGRLLDCDPIYVSEEMCEVVDHARHSFAPEPLLETDLLTPRGFLWFDQPIMLLDKRLNDLAVRACSWAREYHTPATEENIAAFTELHSAERTRKYGDVVRAWETEELIKQGHLVPSGVSVTLYADRDHYLRNIELNAELANRTYEVPPAIWEETRTVPVVPFHLTPWHYGMTFDGNDYDEGGEPTGARDWWTLMQTTFRMMQQKIAHKGYGRPDRATRREGAKLGVPPEREVVIVRLRREEGERHEPSGEEASYSHRFIVSGHWRNQPYPSEGIYRQIWISPFVKGPEDKPLIVRPRRVYQWER